MSNFDSKQIKALAEQNQWILIGISGCTNSGKTTLCNLIKEKFPQIQIINQDKFFREETDPNHIWVKLDETRKHQNWECLQCIDWNKMMIEIQNLISKKSSMVIEEFNHKNLLIIDGHIIFNYKPLTDLFHRKYFLRIDNKEKIYERRLKRDYVPADPPGYFDQYVWPLYLDNLNDLINQQNDIVYIDANLDEQSIFNKIFEDLFQKFSKIK